MLTECWLLTDSISAEYAVTDGGGWGNVIGAISEAAFMTGMERNGDIVLLGAYVSRKRAALRLLI